MSKEKIENLTPEQEGLISIYREKWRRIALSTEPIDREKAAEAVDAVYAVIGLYKPRLVFCDSPYIGLGKLDEKLENLLKKGVCTLLHKQWKKECIFPGKNSLLKKLWIELEQQLKRQIDRNFYDRLYRQLKMSIEFQMKQIENQLYKQMQTQLYGKEYLDTLDMVNRVETNIYEDITPLEDLLNISVKSELLACCGSLYDFCISVLNCTYDRTHWEAYQLIVKCCGWLTPFENIAIICDRPRILSFDNQQRLHAEGAPAIRYADGYSLYAYHGVTLPEKYGKIHPNNWQPSWLLEEEDAELRRVLIEGIGYDRITEELGAIAIV